jgi:hypothetical protein
VVPCITRDVTVGVGRTDDSTVTVDATGGRVVAGRGALAGRGAFADREAVAGREAFAGPVVVGAVADRV